MEKKSKTTERIASFLTWVIVLTATTPLAAIVLAYSIVLFKAIIGTE